MPPTHIPSFVLAGLSSGCLLLGACSSAASPVESLSVRELNIVDEHGQTRVRIAAPMPDPQGLKRAVTAYGIQFLSPSGQEIGGLGMIDSIGFRGLCFDSEAGYEAMCMSLIEGQPSITFRHDWKERITMGVVDGVASIVVHDAQGNPRIKLEVDKDGKTRTVGVTPEPAAP
ncbi:hypothetical protein D7X30_23170 [Corallococcus sp. AB011P]|uniref:hypothetical protein n=1 Tax=unclassified Corallococcus TaxID=2685029 RepID=UPI000EA14C48|nr:MULTISPECIES: hypothetical protein [unclassified Corallococcus]RKG56474.1 hypothetical protein D7X30_23170 [Corallococcus sp. AB011P]RKH81557.1 hypothetical protein D7Y21_29990 [Corallococcus sp. AB045]